MLSSLHQTNILRAAGWARFCHLNGEYVWVGPKGEVQSQREACLSLLNFIRPFRKKA
jgi:hypothetical protein